MTYVDGPSGGTPLNAANLNRDFGARPAKWAASTPYIGGTDLCVNPSGDLVSCTVSHTSTGSYDATKWALSATYVPRWKATTAYLAGDAVLSPGGDTVTAKVNFTSGSTFNAANWNLSANYATVPKPVKNPLTGYYHVRGYGGTGDTTTDNDSVVNALIAAVITAGGGTVYFDDDPFITSPVYRLQQMVINGQGNINLEIKAAPNVVIKPAPLLTTDFIVISSGSTSTTDGTFLRRLRLTDLVIQSQGQSQSGSKIDRRAITISQAQDVTLRNVKIFGFKRGGLILTDCFDSYFTDLEIQWCGYGLDNSNYAHALQFLGSLDNSNNNRFTNLHMEHCPMMILVDNNSRQNSFVDSKFEDGTETEKNTSTISPFYFKQAIEIMFTGGFFSVDYTSDVPMIRTDDNTNSYLTTYNVRQAIKFSNLLFFANSANKARWFSGYNTDFHNVTVNRANGGSASYAFDFNSRNTFRGGTITMADNSSGFFRLQGDNNIVDTPTLVTFGDGAGAGTAAFVLSSGATNNLVRDWLIKGSIGSEVALGGAFGTAGTTGNNIFIHSRDNNATTSGGGVKNVFHREYLKLTDSSAGTYTGFANGFTGQKITVFATTANVTLQHGTAAGNIAMKSGANVTLAANETRTFINIDGVWREN